MPNRFLPQPPVPSPQPLALWQPDWPTAESRWPTAISGARSAPPRDISQPEYMHGEVFRTTSGAKGAHEVSPSCRLGTIRLSADERRFSQMTRGRRLLARSPSNICVHLRHLRTKKTNRPRGRILEFTVKARIRGLLERTANPIAVFSSLAARRHGTMKVIFGAVNRVCKRARKL
jgi:hypothetical protein